MAQLQLVFLASWRYHGGTSHTGQALEDCFPQDALEVSDDVTERTPATVLWNVPETGHHPISDALTRMLAAARQRIEIVNPYISDQAVLRLLHPEMAHAKVATVDDHVLIGGCNLDDLSLIRNDELDVLLVGQGVVEQVDRAVFDELAEMSSPARPSTKWRERVWNATMNRLSPWL